MTEQRKNELKSWIQPLTLAFVLALVGDAVEGRIWRATTESNRFRLQEWTVAKDWIDHTFLTLPGWSDRINRNEKGIDELAKEVRSGFEKIDSRLDVMAETLAELRAERIKGT